MSFFGIPIRNGLSLGLGTVASLTNGPGFLPDELFYGGTVQGAWYDPSDINTYTAQSGPELIVNGNFSNGTTGWSATSATLSAASNQLTITSTSNFGVGASTGFTTVVGRWYKASATLVSCSSATARIRKTDSPTDFNSSAVHLINNVGWTPGQTFTVYFQATATTTYIMAVTDVNPSNITIANVSVVETISVANATLFQDSAGTTPVTAVEQPVGLMLDKSKGLVLGSELVTNGDFSQGATGWTVGTDWSISSGQASHVAGASLSNLFIATPLFVSGLTYQLTIDIVSISGGNLTVFCGDASSITFNTPGTKTMRLRAAGDLRLYIQAAAATVVTVDNISAKLLPGNHAYQSTSASRPTLRARYNLLERSEDFSNAYWTKSGTSVNTVAGIAPDGTNTANKIYPTSTGAFRQVFRTLTTVAISYVATVYAKAAEKNIVAFVDFAGGAGAAWFNLSTGVASNVVAGYTATITSVGNGWYRCSLTGTAPAGLGYYSIFIADSAGSSNVTANGTDGVLLWGAQLTQPAVFPSNTYQRVGAATDYATGAAFPPYLFFDGIDDSMLTNSVDFATVTSDGQARRNLLSVPTLFNDTTGWAVARAAIAVSTAVSPPAGISNLFKLTEDTTASNTHQFLSFSDTTVVNGTRYVSSIYARAAERSWIALQEGQGVTATAYFDLATGAIGTISGTGSPTASIENIGSGWYRCSISWVASGTAARVRVYLATGDNGAVYTGNGTSGAYLSAAQLETGSTATAFQNIGTDKMLVVAGVTKSSDAARGIVVELSASTAANNGSFRLAAPEDATFEYSMTSRGTSDIGANIDSATYAAPNTSVLSGTANIGAPSVALRINGTQVAINLASQGTGNYGNYPLYIGRRNNASLPFNGNLYSLVIAGAAYSAGQISSTESWVAAKTPLGTI